MIGMTGGCEGTAGLGCPARRTLASSVRDRRGEGGTPSRQPAGRRRYMAVIFLGLAACVQLGQAQSFNAGRAMQYTREVVAFGARPIGSPNH